MTYLGQQSCQNRFLDDLEGAIILKGNIITNLCQKIGLE